MHRNPTIPALALLAALGMAAALLVRRDPPPPPDNPAAPTAAAPTDLQPAWGEGPVVADAADATADNEERSEASEPERTEYGGGEAEAPEGPVVAVFAGSPPQPVADVEVAWVELDAGRAMRTRLPAEVARSIDEFDLPRCFGRSARTGPDGTLRLPPQQRMFVVAAHTEREFAAKAVGPNQTRVRLLLVRDETVQLQAVDRQDHGLATLPVTIASSVKGKAQIVWHGVTDSQGHATARHFQLRRRGEPNARHCAIAATPLATPVVVEFAGNPATTTPVVLRIEPTGQVLASVVHRSGAPLLAAVDVQLAPDRKIDPALARLVPGDFDRAHLRKPPGTDPLLFARVGRGVPIRPMLQLDGESRPMPLPERPPLPPGDAPLPVTLVLPDHVVVLAAAIRQPDGTALANARCSLFVAEGSVTVAVGELATLADGRADFAFGWRSQQTARALAMTLRATGPDDVVCGAVIGLGAIQPGQRLDLGPVRLQPQPTLASGSVLDDAGTPLADARVLVQTLVATSRGDRWIEVPLCATATAADGTFAIRAAPPPGPYRVHASRRGHLDADSAPLSLASVVDLRLQRVGALAGQVLLPDWLPAGTARLSLQSNATDGSTRTPGTQLGGRGFRLGDLEPGLYTATVTVRNLPEPLAVFANVSIAPGENRDARLCPLDLSASLFRYRLRAIGPGGTPLSELEGPILWRVRRPAGEQTFAAFRWQKGRAELITQEPFVELVTLARGCAPTSVSLAPGDHDIYLQPVQPFAVELPGVRALAGAGRAIRVSAIFTGDTGLPQGVSGQDQRSGDAFAFPRWELGKSGGGWLDEFDRAELQLSRGGPHEIVLRLYDSDRRDGRQASLTLGTVEVVVDGSAARATTIAVDSQQLAAALQSLAGAPPTQRR